LIVLLDVSRASSSTCEEGIGEEADSTIDASG
jgi:hypothetical protein